MIQVLMRILSIFAFENTVKKWLLVLHSLELTKLELSVWHADMSPSVTPSNPTQAPNPVGDV